MVTLHSFIWLKDKLNNMKMKYLKKFNEVKEYDKVISDIKEILSQLYPVDGNMKMGGKIYSRFSSGFVDVDFKKSVSWEDIKTAVLEVNDYLEYEYPGYELDFIRLNGRELRYSKKEDDFLLLNKYFIDDEEPMTKLEDNRAKSKNIRELIIYFKIPKNINESKVEKGDKPKLEFKKKLRKKGAKTDVYDVLKNGKLIGQVKWYSRVMGYAFRPTADIEPEIKSFIKALMSERKKSK